MKKLIITITIILTASIVMASGCFLSHSYVSGMNRICIYDCIDGQRAITIDATDLCPLSL